MSNFFNNGQRMPNIFERARAYDNWNEGYVQQQKPKTNIVVNTNRIDQPPETLAKDKGMIHGIGKRDNNILTILKVESLLKRDF